MKDFTFCYHDFQSSATTNFKNILMKHSHIITGNNTKLWKVWTQESFHKQVEYDRPGERAVLNRTVVVGNNTLAQIYPNAPIIAHPEEKSLKDFLARAKIPSL